MSPAKARTIKEKLEAMNAAISGSRKDPLIMARVAEFGFDETSFQSAETLYEAALEAVAALEAATGSQRAATKRKRTAYQTARRAYQELARGIRASFQDTPHLLAEFNLAEQPDDLPGFLINAQNVFKIALGKPAVQAKLLQRNWTQERIRNRFAMIEALNAANLNQRDAVGNKQRAADQQKKALADMHRWYAEYSKYARIALQDDAQLLEKLGIAARTSRTAAQAAALRKRRESTPESAFS